MADPYQKQRAPLATDADNITVRIFKPDRSPAVVQFIVPGVELGDPGRLYEVPAAGVFSAWATVRSELKAALVAELQADGWSKP